MNDKPDHQTVELGVTSRTSAEEKTDLNLLVVIPLFLTWSQVHTGCTTTVWYVRHTKRPLPLLSRPPEQQTLGKREQQQQTCLTCNGEGVRLHVDDTGTSNVICTVCFGCGQKETPVYCPQTVELTVVVPPGERIGSRYNFPDVVNPSAIIQLQLKVVEHPVFQLLQKAVSAPGYTNTLCVHQHISLWEALFGFVFDFVDVAGRCIRVKSQAERVYEPGQIFTLPKLGCWNSERKCRDDLLVAIEVEFPEHVDQFTIGGLQKTSVSTPERAADQTCVLDTPWQRPLHNP